MKRCTVVFATPSRQWLWRVEVPDPATVGEVLAQARAGADHPDVPWDGPVGIFGLPCERNAIPRDGDRVEIYRELRADPKESRRARAKAGKQAQDSVARPRPSRSRS